MICTQNLDKITRCLFKDKVAYGYCAAKNEHYYGFKLLLVTTGSGIAIDYVVDAANTDERELLLRANLPENSQVIGDKGFIGGEFANVHSSVGLEKELNPVLVN
jgi:pyruvate/2-oxoglutarate dehydrogenase complex dihydrolipoamide dehydrogenase (E3) component